MCTRENSSSLNPLQKRLSEAGLKVRQAREKLCSVLPRPGHGLNGREGNMAIAKLPLARLTSGVRGTAFATPTQTKKAAYLPDGPSSAKVDMKDGFEVRRVSDSVERFAPSMKPKVKRNFGERLRSGVQRHGAKLLAPFVIFGVAKSASKDESEKGDNNSGVVALSSDTASSTTVEKKKTISGWGNFIAGFTAGGVAKTVVSPLEVSFRYIASSGASPNVFKTVGMVVGEKGVGGLWAGNIANCIRNGPNKAIQFAIYSPLSNLMQKFQPDKDLSVGQRALCGAISGVGATYVVYPLDLVSMRQSVSPPGTYKNMFHAFTKTIQQGGVLSLYQGLGPSLLWVIPYYGVQFSSYDWIKAEYCKRTGCSTKELNTLHTLAFGSFAGAAACTATHPFEVIRRKLQVQGLGGGAVQYKGVIDCVRKMYAADGLAAFGKGIVSNNIRLIPATGVQFLVYEICKDLLSKEVQ